MAYSLGVQIKNYGLFWINCGTIGVCMRDRSSLGVRGAGKSSVGRLWLSGLTGPSWNLTRGSKRCGFSLAEIFSMGKSITVRWNERHSTKSLVMALRWSLRRVGIVTDAENYRMLRDTAHTIWLSAHPEDHWNRVIDQGDCRPMRDHPQRWLS